MTDYIGNIPDTGRKRIVVVGAGFAGLKLVRKLRKKGFQLVLIDRFNYNQFQPLFYQVATAGLEPGSVAFPLRKIFQNYKDAHFRMAELVSVDPAKKEIRTTIGLVSYDYLVMALGTRDNFFGMEEVEEKSLSMKSIPDALTIRNILLENIEKALNTKDEEERKSLLNIVITGGGPTGVELAGALAEMKSLIFPKDYPELNLKEMNIILLEGLDRLLLGMSDFAAARAKKDLEMMGVKVQLGAMVNGFDGNKVSIRENDPIPTKTLIWTAGVRAVPIKGLEMAELESKGRFRTDRYHRMVNYPDIFVLGDLAYMEEEDYPKGHPQLAAPAIQQAENLAANLARGVKENGWKSFSYKHKGTMATIGRSKAVVDIRKLHFGGFLAWILWLFVHLITIFGGKNKVFVLISWFYNYLRYDQSQRIILRSEGK